MNDTWLYIGAGFLLILLGSVLTMGAYTLLGYDKKFNGLYFKGNITHNQAIAIGHEYDAGGNWVCVNVRDMAYKDAVETCNHEAGHEIFAEYCQNHIEQCINITGEK